MGPRSEEEWDILKRSCGDSSPVQRNLFILAEAGTHLSASATVCVCTFWKIGNKRNWLYLCWCDSSLEIRSPIFYLHCRLHHYDENPKKLCSRGLEGAAVLQSVPSGSALLRVLADWMIGGSQMQAGVLVGSESGSASFSTSGHVWSKVVRTILHIFM